MKWWIIVLIVIGSLIFLLFLMSLIIANIIFNQSLTRQKKPKMQKSTKKALNNDKWDKIRMELTAFKDEMINKSERVEMKSEKGFNLIGYLFHQNKESDKWIVISHGWKSDALSDFGLSIKFLYEQGYNILSVNHQAHGESEGKIIGFGVLDNVEILKWVDFLNKRFNKCKVILWGISMGASTVLYTANKVNPDIVKGIIADCGYTSPYEEFTYVIENHMHLPKWPFMNLMYMITKLRGHYNIKESTIDSVKDANVPILYICGDNDNFVPLFFTQANYEKTSSRKELVIVKNATHGMSSRTEPELYKEKVNNFINSCC